MSKSVGSVEMRELAPGEVKSIKVKNGEVTTIPFPIPQDVIFTLNSVSVTAGDKEIVLGKEQDGKRFVPSFELAKSAEEFIVNYFAEATDDQPAIKLRGLVSLADHTVSFTGEGFEEAVLEVTEYKEVRTSTIEVTVDTAEGTIDSKEIKG